MTKITLDAALREKLQDLTQPLEICDDAGRVVAHLFPVYDMTEWEPLTPEISEEELERRMNSKEKRYTTAEVIAYLESL